ESAVIPTISGSPSGGPRIAPRRAPVWFGAPELINSVRFNPFSLQALDRQRLSDRGRCLIDRRNAQYRRDPLDDAAGPRRPSPAGGRVTEALLGAVRLVDQRQDRIARIMHRKGADEGR